MKINFECSEALPKLAWHASIDQLNEHCHVRHGPWVEVFNNGFVEGVWDGPFNQFLFDQSACIFGSGAILKDQTITFVSSTSTTDCLYYSSTADRVEVSNSLPLLLAINGDELDPGCKEYHLINESITNGIRKYIKKIPTKNSSVNRLIHFNLAVNKFSTKEIEKNLEPVFNNFDEYYNYLNLCYKMIFENSVDRSRKKSMMVFSTQSKGYDSTAVNAIAKNYHIDKVFTVTKGKAKGSFWGESLDKEPDDDGAEICAVFGINCVKLDRHLIENIEDGEYRVHATLHDSGDLNLLAISSFVEKPTILLTGCLGEIWYTNEYYNEAVWKLSPELVRGDLGNHGMTETRLEAGYVQVAFPFIGARSRQCILNITMSAEMAPWRLETTYDRPIPRRIAEEAGLARHMFGQVKMASVVELPQPLVPVGKILRQDFFKFLIDEKVLKRHQLSFLPLVHKWNAIVAMTSPRTYRWNYYLQRLISKLTNTDFRFKPLWSSLNGQIFCFCVNKMVREYSVKTKRLI
ncbi:MAG: hypothetical protein U0989_03730 [Azonexus sp.]|nr:hypothetical protein [Azonexus sp.]